MPFFYITLVILVLAALVVLHRKYKKQQTMSRIINGYGVLEEHDLRPEDIASIHRSYQHLKKEDDLDAITWNDLDLESLYWQINSTHCTHGDEWLYARLHRQRPADRLELDELVTSFSDHESPRIATQIALENIGKHTDHDSYDFLESLERLKIAPPLTFLLQSAGLIASLVLIPFVPQLAITLAILLVIFNVYTYHERNPTRKYTQNLQFIATSIKNSAALPPLDHPVYQRLQSARKKLLPIARSIRLSTGTSTTNEVGYLFQGIDSVLLITPLFMSQAIAKLKHHKTDIKTLFEALGMIDGSISIASYKKALPYACEPCFTDENKLDFEELVHPLLIHNNGVSNTRQTPTQLLFTGSNASGKSTFVKALALNVHLGQTLNLCTAKAFHYQPAYVYTSMALRDNVQSGKSYFIVELESLRRILDASKQHDHCFIVVDEILRGTNTIERIAASSSILKELHKTAATICVATHDIELTQILAQQYANYHFRETVNNAGIAFDFKLHDGPSTTTNAIKLLGVMDFDKSIVDESNHRVEHFRTHKSWL